MPLLPTIPELLKFAHGLNVSSSSNSPPFPFDLSLLPSSPSSVILINGRVRASEYAHAPACSCRWPRPGCAPRAPTPLLPCTCPSGPACCFSCYCVALLLPVATAVALVLLLAASGHNGLLLAPTDVHASHGLVDAFLLLLLMAMAVVALRPCVLAMAPQPWHIH